MPKALLFAIIVNVAGYIPFNNLPVKSWYAFYRFNCIPGAKRGYYGFIIVVVRVVVRIRRDFLLATYSPHFFPDFFHIWQVA